MAHELAYVNGKLLPIAEAVVPVHDRSFLYGDGAFDTAVARQRCVYKLTTSTASSPGGRRSTPGWTRAILLDGRGCETEGSGDNLFAVQGDRLRTPPAVNILEGVTRETLLALAPRAGLSPEAAELTPYDLYTADEVFLTSTVVGVLPIVELDGRPIGGGRVGPVAGRLRALYEATVVAEGEPIGR